MSGYDPVQAVLDRLENLRQHDGYHTARCPAHDDRHNSLSVTDGDDGRVLLNCHAGCPQEAVVSALDLEMRDLFPRHEGGSGPIPPRSTPQPRNTSHGANNLGCTLADYATFKRLPIDELRSWGLSEITYAGAPAVRIPYRHRNGAVGPIRFRTALHKTEAGDDRFKWKAGSKPMLYGLWRLDTPEYVVLCEGESDCHTLWHHGIPALGIPGASTWDEDRDAPHLDGIPTIYVVVEPDTGGDTVVRRLAKSRIRERLRLVSFAEGEPGRG